MEYIGNVKWWNTRFKERKLNLGKQDEKLESDMNFFNNKGKVLDVACGDGRNSIFLAKQGYYVEAIDFSEEALLRLKYDLIIINHYRLVKSSYSNLQKHLKEDGLLWVNGFCKVPVDNPRITSNNLLTDEDFEYLSNCSLVSKDIYDDESKDFVRYCWRKNSTNL